MIQIGKTPLESFLTAWMDKHTTPALETILEPFFLDRIDWKNKAAFSTASSVNYT